MIDWHTHILPGVDDGCRDVEESISILKHYRDKGISAVVLTPHFYPHKESVGRFLKRRKRAVKRLEDEIAIINSKEKPLPQIAVGAEVYFYPELAMMEEKQLRELCIGDSRYLMVELPLEPWDNTMYNVLENLIYNRGIIPILAHIDRYHRSIKNPTYLKELVDMGMLIQLNTEALDGILSRKKALRWFKAGYVQLLGSDCHNMTTRKPDLYRGFEIIKKHLGKGGKKQLTELDICDILNG